MPDITMCTGGGCPWKNECYRYRAIPSPHHQSYMGPPYKDNDCKHFVEIVSHDELLTCELCDGSFDPAGTGAERIYVDGLIVCKGCAITHYSDYLMEQQNG